MKRVLITETLTKRKSNRLSNKYMKAIELDTWNSRKKVKKIGKLFLKPKIAGSVRRKQSMGSWWNNKSKGKDTIRSI